MQRVKPILLIYGLLLFLYAILRLIFFSLYFADTRIDSRLLLSYFYWGTRFDSSAVFYSNLLFFCSYFFLASFISRQRRTAFLVTIFAISNIPFLAVNIIDLAYFRFNLRRSSIDFLHVIKDSLSATNAFLFAWWWLLLLFILVSVILLLSVRSIIARYKQPAVFSIGRVFSAFVFLGLAGLFARGTEQLPLEPSTALLHAPAQFQPLLTNSTITMLYSLVKHQTTLKEKHYFDPSTAAKLFPLRKQKLYPDSMRKMNVVLLVLESFAKEYVDPNSTLHASTPFIDSIIAQSTVCDSAYSNGTESNKGLTSILASIPPFFDEPYYYSSYSNNNIRGIGSLLTEKGYTCNFFMGAGYDHFGFARLAHLMGIEHYYSMKDYGNDQDYDGNWGIFDHRFLPFTANRLKLSPKPFFSTIFNLSTHFPYTLPNNLKARFTLPGQGAEQNSMSYVDYSLQLFFKSIQDEPWYRQTIFVFVADHNIFWKQRERATVYQRFRIPLFIYQPGEPKSVHVRRTVQQLDVVPTILDLLHYNQPYMAFGHSVFDSVSPAIAINRIDDIYQAIDSFSVFGYNERREQPAYLYNFHADPALTTNLLQNPGEAAHLQRLSSHLKAALQQFNHSMTNNKLYIK